MVKLVNTGHLKCPDLCGLAGSSPALSTSHFEKTTTKQMTELEEKEPEKLNNKTIIKTTNDNQIDLIGDIITLYCPEGIDLDPTYSKGIFYKCGKVKQPKIKSDLYPKTEDIIEADAADLKWLEDGSIKNIMFDPPFLAGYTKKKPTGHMGKRFHGFRYVPDLWEWYDKSLEEFYRVLEKDGVLIFKCQDTVSSGKQWLSHVHIINKAESLGFYTKDLFVLTAKRRMIGHNHNNQKHARKFHSYFLVFIKKTNS